MPCRASVSISITCCARARKSMGGAWRRRAAAEMRKSGRGRGAVDLGAAGGDSSAAMSDASLPIRAAVETARAHGVEVDRREILQDGHTVVVRLSESLVARVVTDREGPRQGGEWFARESAVACHLAGRGAPVIPMHLAIPPGPHERLGLTLNFWKFVRVIDAPPAPEEIGSTLEHCHRLLRSFAAPLPELGILDETAALLTRLEPGEFLSTAALDLLRRRLGESRDALSRFPMQPLHGDAHEGNLLATSEGLLWTDWEDTFLGPVEWDLASILWNPLVLEGDRAHAARILAAYRAAGGSVDHRALDHALVARAAVMSAWYPLLYPNPSPERREKLRFRLNWLAGATATDTAAICRAGH
ncbi:MAG: aminoglycoside phosphotransferase family protein [Verrucomicrobia bacterium]|nr:MAG: aminoglycoside phosphotransferase family protein [Verrucomicrobiota bacterium]TAF42308.1 MAG: aminoglycoside phosphotransferase family protein [Verrucomicrobiota bacterium]